MEFQGFSSVATVTNFIPSVALHQISLLSSLLSGSTTPVQPSQSQEAWGFPLLSPVTLSATESSPPVPGAQPHLRKPVLLSTFSKEGAGARQDAVARQTALAPKSVPTYDTRPRAV